MNIKWYKIYFNLVSEYVKKKCKILYIFIYIFFLFLSPAECQSILNEGPGPGLNNMDFSSIIYKEYIWEILKKETNMTWDEYNFIYKREICFYYSSEREFINVIKYEYKKFENLSLDEYLVIYDHSNNFSFWKWTGTGIAFLYFYFKWVAWYYGW